MINKKKTRNLNPLFYDDSFNNFQIACPTDEIDSYQC